MEKKSIILAIISIILALIVGLFGGYILTNNLLGKDNISNNGVDKNNIDNIVNSDLDADAENFNNDNKLECEPIVKILDYEELGKEVFIDYIKERGAVNYQINSVNLVIGCSKQFILSIGYDVEVEGNPHNSNFGAGNGYFDGQWIRDKAQFVTFLLEDDKYIIHSMGTGLGDSFQSCSEGKIVFGLD